VQISGTFKKDERIFNGLEAIAKELIEHPLTRHLVVGVIETSGINKTAASNWAETATVRFPAIEVVTGDAAITVRGILEAAYAERTGRSAPPDTLFSAPGVDEPDAAKVLFHDPSQCGPVYADDKGEELVGYCTEPAGHDQPAKGKGTGHRYRDDWTDQSPSTPAKKG